MLKKNLYLLFIAAAIIVLLTGYILKNSSRGNSLQKENAAELAKSLSEKAVNKSYNFSTKDKNGKEIVLKYNIVSAKKVKLIATKGQPYKSGAGEVFVVLSLELQNDSSLPLNVNSADFVRLIKEKNKKYAPDFYNGVVTVLPISVKKDEIAFTVNDTNKVKFQVGDIDKPKKDLEVIF